MPEPVVIALDVMGGDRGAEVVIPGADIVLQRYPGIRFKLVGDEALMKPLLERHQRVDESSDVIHTDIFVRMDDKPSQALRHGRWRSSMWMSLDEVKTGAAHVAVSAGNTGALMAMARFNLKMMAGIDRPAIAAIWPTLRGESIVLDVGATIGADARQLVEFAMMGAAMARALFGIEKPSVGLLNIGVEEVKGLEMVREAHQRLRNTNLPFRYHGFVEGDDLGRGSVDVVVTEGFSGNIALKSAEGTAKQIGEYLRAAMNRTLLAKIGYLFAKGAFDTLREKMDPRSVNGGVFLGLNGVVIKSHGGTDAEGFASAVALGYDMVVNGLLSKISNDLVHMQGESGDDVAPEVRSVAS